MTKRRGKIIENEVSVLPPLVKGGDDFDYCVSLFLDEMELKAYPIIQCVGIKRTSTMSNRRLQN